jgi:hypothetical protein
VTDLLPYASVAVPAGFVFLGTWLVQRNAKRATNSPTRRSG